MCTPAVRRSCLADQELLLSAIAGQLSGSSGTAFGASVNIVERDESVSAEVTNVNVLADGAGAAIAVPTGKRDGGGSPITTPVNGVAVVAVSFSDIDSIAVGGTGAGDFALGGSYVENDVEKDINSGVTGNADVTAATSKVHVAAANNSQVDSLGRVELLERRRRRSEPPCRSTASRMISMPWWTMPRQRRQRRHHQRHDARLF